MLNSLYRSHRCHTKRAATKDALTGEFVTIIPSSILELKVCGKASWLLTSGKPSSSVCEQKKWPLHGKSLHCPPLFASQQTAAVSSSFAETRNGQSVQPRQGFPEMVNPFNLASWLDRQIKHSCCAHPGHLLPSALPLAPRLRSALHQRKIDKMFD